MKTTSPAASRLSVLSLRVEVVDTMPTDRPVVTILVDGAPPFEGVAPGWRGFDPDAILGRDTPLLPPDHGRRTALYSCSCGIGGCGVIAPYVVPSPDGRRVSWVDHRDYVGVFDGPLARDSQDHEGRPWDLPDLHFGRAQYEAEVARASADHSWETPRRTASRLVRERLAASPDALPAGFSVRWVVPAWDDEDCLLLGLAVVLPSGEVRPDGPTLRVPLPDVDPNRSAHDIVERLRGCTLDELVRDLGHR